LSAPVSLSSLLRGLAAVPRDVLLTDVTLDSRQVKPGGAFLACRGMRRHGLDFAPDVVRSGAAAVLWEPDGVHRPPELDSQIIVAEVADLGAHASLIADRFFGSPSRQLDVVGVTGTNGKTTCAWLLAQALDACDLPAAYLGTLGSAFGGVLAAGEMTTPDAVTVQREMAAFAARGARGVAMEVSSHGLAQGRVAAVHFDAAVFTNLTRDHLDFHGDMDRYGAAKASLFERADVRLRVFNTDDAFGARLSSRPEFADRIVCSSREDGPLLSGAFLQARRIRFTATGTAFTLESSFGVAEVATRLLGAFNVDNVLAVLAVLLGSGVTLSRAVASLASLTAPCGRLEVIDAPGGPLAVVDYAHTPDALGKALQVLRRHCAGRLILVFGCGGDRDRGKRPQMGALAAALADEVVLTDDNPRTESGDAIIADILAGAGAAPSLRVQRDRRAAIGLAVSAARAGDVVLVAGKGHESVQIVGSERLPFSDQQELRAALGVAA
jgi:UDP-N-acetylmuramoyl-L-alanyl-D-glutamate--2,6-diaminopimelate ligase